MSILDKTESPRGSSNDAPSSNSGVRLLTRAPGGTTSLSETNRQRWRFHMRPADDDEPQSWWFCSTAIPLLAATTGPLANVMSIAGTLRELEYLPASKANERPLTHPSVSDILEEQLQPRESRCRR